MGSGETAPTMAKVHRALFDRFEATGRARGDRSTRRTASRRTRTSCSARTLEFFATSVGNPVEVASFRSRTTWTP